MTSKSQSLSVQRCLAACVGFEVTATFDGSCSFHTHPLAYLFISPALPLFFPFVSCTACCSALLETCSEEQHLILPLPLHCWACLEQRFLPCMDIQLYKWPNSAASRCRASIHSSEPETLDQLQLQDISSSCWCNSSTY
jgi:hypothetical protein